MFLKCAPWSVSTPSRKRNKRKNKTFRQIGDLVYIEYKIGKILCSFFKTLKTLVIGSLNLEHFCLCIMYIYVPTVRALHAPPPMRAMVHPACLSNFRQGHAYLQLIADTALKQIRNY